MASFYNTLLLRGITVLGILLFWSSILIAQNQEFTLPNNSIGHREHMLNVSDGDLISIDGFEIDGTYSLMLVDQDQTCEAELIVVDESTLKYSKNKNAYSITPLASKISFEIDMGACKKKKEDLVLSFFCMSCSMPETEPSAARMDGIMTDANFSPDALVRDVLIGGGCFEVNNVAPIGIGQMAFFSGGTSSIGFEEGVIISTGAPAIAHGPNNIPNAGTTGGGGGDVDLGQLSSPIIDASGVQFSFTPTESQIAFNYVFASEEYCEFSQTGFNDVFGFFISGPGINGGFSMNGENIAVLPGGGVDVSINNVNQFNNTAYYVDNTPINQPQFGGNPADCDGVIMQDGIAINDCQFDGFTGNLTAVADVIPCETYLIRLVVGDVLDGIYDSAVFLEANSFSAGGQGNIAADIPGLTPEGFGVAYEGCADGFLVFNRIGNDLSEPVEIIFSVDPSSTAEPGVDFTDLPGSVIIPPGSTQVLVPFTVFNDFIFEGVETLIINIDNPCTCTQSSITILLDDVSPLDAPPEEFNYCTAQPVTLTAQPTGGAAPYTYAWDTGLNSQSITVNPFESETYTVTITDNCGNEVISEHTVNVTGVVGATVLGDIEICGEFPEGYIPIDLFGNGPWDLVYSFNGDVQPVIENIQYSPYELFITEPGVYQLLLVSTNGCPGAATGFSIVTINEIEFIVEAENPNCAGANTGSINLIPTDGTPGYGYEWVGTNQQNSSPNDLTAGTYNVTITDSEGCVGEGEITLTEPDSIEAEIVDQVNVNCLNPTNGSFAVDLTGGTPDYTVTWNNGLPEGPTQNNLSPGIYEGLITDSIGCTTNVETEILADFEEPTAVANAMGQFTCIQEEVMLSAAGSSQDSNFIYNWMDSAGNSIGTGNEQVVDEQGTYTLVVTNSNNGCLAEAEVTPEVEMTVPMAVIVDPEQLDCDTDEVLLNGSNSSGSGALTYEWFYNNQSVSIDAEMLASEPGDYTLVVTNSLNGCTHETDIPVVEDVLLPVADAGMDQEITCDITTVTLGSGSTVGYTYSWLDGDLNMISDQPTVDVLSDGTYILVVTNSLNGCEQQDAVSVNLNNALPEVEATSQGIISCINDQSILNGNGSASGSNYQYSWTDSLGNEVSDELSAVVYETGTYNLTVLNTLTGCEDNINAVVTDDLEEPMAVANPLGELTCAIQSVELSGQGSTDHADILYGWTDADGNFLGNTINQIVEEEGVYTLTVVDGANGCTSVIDVTVSIDNIEPIADIIDPEQLDCDTDQVLLDGTTSSGTSSLTYEWFFNNQSIGATDQIMVGTVGEYSLVVTDESNGCIHESSIDVLQDITAPDVDAGPNQILTCAVDNVTLFGTGNTGNNFEYTWLNENLESIGNNLSVVVDSPGIYTLVIENTTTACVFEATVVVSPDDNIPLAVATEQGTITCDNPEATLIGTGSETGSTIEYTWTNATGGVVGNELTAVVTQSGTYTLSVFNSENGCESSMQVDVPEDLTQPDAQAGPDALLTCTETQVELIGSTSVLAGHTFAWYNDAGILLGENENITLAQAGDFTFVVTAPNGCTSEDIATVELNADVPVADAGTNYTITCDNDQFTIGGPLTTINTNLEYVWLDENQNQVSNQPTFSINYPGTFTLYVSDPINNCESFDAVVVNETIELPIVEVGTGGTLNCNVEEFILGGTGSSQGSEYTYTWTNQLGQVVGAEIFHQTNVPGNYTLTILNTNTGCESQDLVIVDENVATPSAEAGPNGILTCDSDFVILDAAGSSAGTSFTYQWFNEGGVLIGEQSTVSVDQTGEYELVITNTINGCFSSDITNVDPDVNLPVATAGLGQTLNCTIQEVALSALGSTTSSGQIEVQWFDPNDNFISSEIDILTGIPGIYTVVILDTSNGCDATATVNVDQDLADPVVDAGDNQILDCATDMLSLLGLATGSGNFSFEWTDSDGFVLGNQQSLNVDQPDTYTLTVIDLQNGCSSVDDVIINPDLNAPDALAGPDGILNCDVLNYEINATASSIGSGITYSWIFENQLISDDLILNINEAGTYTLLVTDTNNGCESMDNVIVTQNIEDPIADIQQIGASSLDCDNLTVLLDGINSFPQGNISYSWSETGNPTNVLGINSSLEVDGPGTYQLVVENLENGCVDEIPFTVLQDIATPEPNIPDPDLLTCLENSLELSVDDLADLQLVDILWNSTVPGGILSDPTNPIISVGQPGQYSVLMINPENGCQGMAEVTVTSNDEYPTAIANVEDELNCVTEQVSLSGIGSSDNGNFSYQWTGPSILSGATGLNPVVSEAGEYQIEVTNQDNGCKTIEDITVLENLDVPIDLVAEIVPPPCFNDPGSVSIVAVEGGAGPYQYSIGTTSNYSDISTFENLASGSYQVYIIDDIGCTYEESIFIPMTTPIQAILEGEIQISLGENTQLNTILTFPENEVTSIVWTPTETLSCDDCLNPFASPTETTIYRIMVTDANGCPAEDDVLVRVKPERGVYIPNAFSPNADFTNDIFHIFGNTKAISQIDNFIIADRWGEIVYRDENFQPNDPAHGWDGYLNGRLMNPAVFVYYAEITFIDGKTEVFKGDVTLMR